MTIEPSEKQRECPSFDECKAPLCPLGEASKDIVWYPGESICAAKPVRNLDWVRMQRRLVRAKKKGFFNIEMLVVMKKVTDGVDPDTRQTPEAWIKRRVK